MPMAPRQRNIVAILPLMAVVAPQRLDATDRPSRGQDALAPSD